MGRNIVAPGLNDYVYDGFGNCVQASSWSRNGKVDASFKTIPLANVESAVATVVAAPEVSYRIPVR